SAGTVRTGLTGGEATMAPYEQRADVMTSSPAPDATVAPGEQRSVSAKRTGWAPRGVGPGLIVGVLGTLGVALSLVLPWRIGSGVPSGIPVAFLFDDTSAGSGPSLLIVLIPLVVMLAVGALFPAASAVRVIGAIGTLIVAALFVYQLSRVTEHTNASTAD